MHISVFCGASLPHSEQITEAARQLGRAIARGGHTLETINRTKTINKK